MVVDGGLPLHSGVEIRLEGLDGILPADCFAVLRLDGVAACAPFSHGGAGPVLCQPHKATTIGQAPLGHGAVSVDIFHKVGTVSLGISEPGLKKVADVDWPGRALKVRVTTVSVAPPDAQADDHSQSPSSQSGQTMGLRELQQMIKRSSAVGHTELRNREFNSHSDPRRALAESGGHGGSPPNSNALGTWPSKRADKRPTLSELDFSAKRRRDASSSSRSAAVGQSPDHSRSPQDEGFFHPRSLPSVQLEPQEEPEEKADDSPKRSPRERPVSRVIVLNNANCIIPRLHLGGVQSVSDTQNLVDQGIRAITCCMRDTEFPESDFCPQIEYYRVDVEDISREPIELFWEEATEFMHSWIEREQDVLVYCRAGVSRSASTVMAYLVRYHGYSLRDAFFLTRKSRGIATPNVGFMQKLQQWERDQTDCAEPSIDLDKYISWLNAHDPPAVPDLAPD